MTRARDLAHKLTAPQGPAAGAGVADMTPADHILAAQDHLQLARMALEAERVKDSIGCKPRALRFVENALLALSQVWG